MFAIDHCQIQDPRLLATGEPSIDVEGRARDPLSAADLFGLGPGLVLPQYPDDLLLAEAAPSHRPSPFSGDGLYLISEEFSGCRPPSVRHNFGRQRRHRSVVFPAAGPEDREPTLRHYRRGKSHARLGHHTRPKSNPTSF